MQKKQNMTYTCLLQLIILTLCLQLLALRALASCAVGSGFYGWCRQRSIGACRGRADPELGSALLWAEGML